MKILLLAFFMLPCFFSSTAQKNDTLMGKVYYTFKYRADTLFKNNFREEQMGLLLGTGNSLYYSIDQERKDSVMKEQLASSGGMVVNASGKKTTSTRILRDPMKKKWYVMERLIRSYVYEDDAREIDWKIRPEKKMISGISCSMATGSFRGREYTAWFAMEIPVAAGPWKLAGLPGLILEAYDSKGDVFFTFDGIERPSVTTRMGKMPDDAIQTTKKDYLRLKEAAQNDPIGFANNASIEAGSGIRLNTDNNQGNFKPKKPNNPLELTD